MGKVKPHRVKCIKSRKRRSFLTQKDFYPMQNPYEVHPDSEI